MEEILEGNTEVTKEKSPAKPKSKRPVSSPRRVTALSNGISTELEQYCRLRATGMTVVDACRAIRKSETAGYHWEGRPEVKARIEVLNALVTDAVLKKNGIDRNWVTANLRIVAERCMQAEPVRDNDGNPTGEYTFDSGGALKALELLGKDCGMFKSGETSSTTNNIVINNLPETQLREMIAALSLEVLGHELPVGEVYEHDG